jgi:hypothetical protein
VLSIRDPLRNLPLAIAGGYPTTVYEFKIAIASCVGARGSRKAKDDKRNRSGKRKFVHRSGSCPVLIGSMLEFAIADLIERPQSRCDRKGKRNANCALFRSVPSAEHRKRRSVRLNTVDDLPALRSSGPLADEHDETGTARTFGSCF